jgi:hypothetical protein
MAKHPVYYQALAIQNEIAWLQTLIQAGGVEETIKVDGKSRKITRDPKTGRFGGGGKQSAIDSIDKHIEGELQKMKEEPVSQDDQFGKMGPSKPGDAAYEKKGAGPIPQTLEGPEAEAQLKEASVKSNKAIDAIKGKLKNLPAGVKASGEEVSKKAKAAGAAISAQLDKAGETKLGKSIGKATSSIADKVGEMKEATTEKMGKLAGDIQEQVKPENLKKLGKEAADTAEAMAVGLAINMTAFAVGGAVAGAFLGIGLGAGAAVALTGPLVAVPVILTMKDLPNYKAIAKGLKAMAEKDPAKKAEKEKEFQDAYKKSPVGEAARQRANNQQAQQYLNSGRPPSYR